MILRDFKCGKCGKVFEELVDSHRMAIKCDCGGKSHITITKSNLSNCHGWNSHWDIQLGQYFESSEQKRDFLKKTGRAQDSGFESPKRSTKGQIICSKEHAIKKFGPIVPPVKVK